MVLKTEECPNGRGRVWIEETGGGKVCENSLRCPYECDNKGHGGHKNEERFSSRSD